LVHYYGTIRTMQTQTGLVTEIRETDAVRGPQRQLLVYIDCPETIIPGPGQYVLDVRGGDLSQDWPSDPVLAPILFPTFVFESELAQGERHGFWAVSPEPNMYAPGDQLLLRGPLGRGFRLSSRTHRLGVAALGTQLARVLPVIAQVLKASGEVVLFCDLPLPARLPPVVEVHPLAELPQVLPWVDGLVVDLPETRINGLHPVLGLQPGTTLPCPGQVLVEIPMPCAGLASCGACAVATKHGAVLACEKGPVISLAEILR
jgi:hypothetical protein